MSIVESAVTLVVLGAICAPLIAVLAFAIATAFQK